MQVIEWLHIQVWQPSVNAPTERVNGGLYFPTQIDMDEADEAVGMVKPLVVVPPMGADFEEASHHAHNLSDLAKHTGMIMHGQWDQLIMQIKWASSYDYWPIIMHPANFVGGQDKSLWQMHQGDSVFKPEGWYHLATSRPHPLDLPGRWTLGGDFVSNNSYGL